MAESDFLSVTSSVLSRLIPSLCAELSCLLRFLHFRVYYFFLIQCSSIIKTWQVLQKVGWRFSFLYHFFVFPTTSCCVLQSPDLVIQVQATLAYIGDKSGPTGRMFIRNTNWALLVFSTYHLGLVLVIPPASHQPSAWCL